MVGDEPDAVLNPKFSSPGATPTPWAEAREQVAAAEIYWLTTVREDGRPHVTPLISVMLDGAFFFCASADERKARNLERNPNVVLTTGSNSLAKGLDIVVEGIASQVEDAVLLQRVSDAYVEKYGLDWKFTVRDGLFHHDDGDPAQVYAITPMVGFGFGRGEFSQTRWRF